MKKSEQSFDSIFFDKEYTQLAGKGNVVVIKIACLLIFTLTAIGFAVGGLEQLEERMNNPFTNWLDLDISPRVEKKLNDLRLDFINEDTLASYHLDAMSEWNKYHLVFHHKKYDFINHPIDTLSYIRMGRTVDAEGALFRQILNPNTNNISSINSSAFSKDGKLLEPCGLIVTEKMMLKLGYTPNDYANIHHLSINLGQGKTSVFQPLIAVVKQLPSLCQFVSTNRLYSITQGQFSNFIKINNNRNVSNINFRSIISSQKDFLKSKINDLLNVEDYLVSEEVIEIDNDRLCNVYKIHMNSSKPTASEIEDFLNYFETHKDFSNHSEIQCGEDADEIRYPHYLSFNFRDLNAIRNFQNKMQSQFDIPLIMEEVESRENFRMVSRLTTTMAFVLFCLGLFSILLYLGNLVQNHILRVKTNLGTFKAMGLSNTMLLSTYRKIVLKLLLNALLFGLPLSLLLGVGLDLFLMIGFNLWHWVIFLAVVIIVIIVLYLIQTILTFTLSASPGDLIYERIA